MGPPPVIAQNAVFAKKRCFLKKHHFFDKKLARRQNPPKPGFCACSRARGERSDQGSSASKCAPLYWWLRAPPPSSRLVAFGVCRVEARRRPMITGLGRAAPARVGRIGRGAVANYGAIATKFALVSLALASRDGKKFLDFSALRESVVSLGAGLRARPRPLPLTRQGEPSGSPCGQPSLTGLATGAVAKVRLKGSGCRKLLPD